MLDFYKIRKIEDCIFKENNWLAMLIQTQDRLIPFIHDFKF